ncbi:MAG: endolytic transglycosylase MltG, partial [Clostridia bacterium]|nr:endolytic transglycosylase MltG [Clostridia bacterium]
MKLRWLPLLLLAALLSGCAVRGGSPPALSAAPPTETTEATVRITFPEGSTVVQMAEKLEANGVCAAAEFLAAARDPAALEAQGFGVDNAAERPFVCEGYVFPDTYDFYRGEDAADFAEAATLEQTAALLWNGAATLFSSTGSGSAPPSIQAAF